MHSSQNNASDDSFAISISYFWIHARTSTQNCQNCQKPRPGAFCRGRGGRGGCAKDGSSWRASPSWASGVALDLALSVLPRTAKLVVLQMISNEKENLRAEVDSRGNCLIVRLFGLFDCHWCYSTFKRRSTIPRIQTQQAPAPVATDESTYQPYHRRPATGRATTNRRINHHQTRLYRLTISLVPDPLGAPSRT